MSNKTALHLIPFVESAIALELYFMGWFMGTKNYILLASCAVTWGTLQICRRALRKIIYK